MAAQYSPASLEPFGVDVEARVAGGFPSLATPLLIILGFMDFGGELGSGEPRDLSRRLHLFL